MHEENGVNRGRTVYFDQRNNDMSISSLGEDEEEDVGEPRPPLRGRRVEHDPERRDVTAELVNTLAKLAANSEIPATPVMYFEQDSADYPAFMRERVGDKPLADSVKLGQLIEHTKGKARDAIEIYRGQARGYQRALTTLAQRYGQPLQIVDALMTRLERQGRIRAENPDDLLQFADRLEAYYSTFVEFDLLREANTQATLKRVFKKLPVKAQYKWIDRVNELDQQRTVPEFKHLVRLVRSQAKRSTHPVYRVDTYQQRDQQQDRGRRQGSTRFGNYQVTTMIAAQGNSANNSGGSWSNKCEFCKKSHKTTDCFAFKRKTPLERKDFVRQNKLCWLCFGPHNLLDCNKRGMKCDVGGCFGEHNPMIHIEPRWPRDNRGNGGNRRYGLNANSGRRNFNDLGRARAGGNNRANRQENGSSVNGTSRREQTQRTEQTAASVDTNAAENTETQEQTTAALKTPGDRVILRVVPVRLYAAGTDRSVTTYGLLDSGSTNSLISEEVAGNLGLQGQKTQIRLGTVTRRESMEVEAVKVEVGHISGKDRMPMQRAQVVPGMRLSPELIQDDIDASQWSHLASLPRPDGSDIDVRQVGVIIGEDCNGAHERYNQVRHPSRPYKEPYGVLTPFGWCLAGPTKGQTCHHVELEAAAEPELKALESAVTRLWEEERHGFGNHSESVSEADKCAMIKMENETYRDADGRYVVPLLWRSESTVLPNNYYGALKYLQSLQKKFVKRPDFALRYREMIENYVNKGYARKITATEAAKTTDRTFYLPHQGVESPHKPGKVRVVFNAAYTYKGSSLNKALYHGPDLTNNMLGILLRFRKAKYALVGDIQEMFHQVKVCDADADSLRFLWLDKPDDLEPSVYRMERHIFGATDSPAACAYALKRTARDNRDIYDKITVETVQNDMYVDDLVKSCETEEETARLGNQLVSLLERGGFRLTKIVSNSGLVLQSLPADRVANDHHGKALDNLPIHRTLGVSWNAECDNLCVQVQVEEHKTTKRGCLSFLCSIFDIMGILAPVILVGRRVLQQAMQRELAWDDPLPEDLVRPWNKWKDSLAALHELRIPRCYLGLEIRAGVRSVQLHHFGDGSEYAYGAVSYLRVESQDGTVQVSLVVGKSRVAPLTFLSIPRLEMQAATVAARIGDFIAKQLDIDVDETFYWTDSTATLGYIRNHTKRLKTYLANRKQEILDATEVSQWRHCPTKDNPADMASRGVLGHQLTQTKWFRGPDFLWKPSSEWPGEVKDIPDLDDDDPEIKKEVTIASLTATMDATILDTIERCSSWMKVRKSIAWLTKFRQWIAHKAKPDQHRLPEKRITTGDLEAAGNATNMKQNTHGC